MKKKHYSKPKTKNIKIVNNNWKKKHINSIKSAYGSAPFFIYYFANIEKIINKHHVFLIDLNNNILDYFLNELNIQKQLIKTTMYNKLYSSNILDQRHKLNEHYSYKKYQQR